MFLTYTCGLERLVPVFFGTLRLGLWPGRVLQVLVGRTSLGPDELRWTSPPTMLWVNF